MFCREPIVNFCGQFIIIVMNVVQTLSFIVDDKESFCAFIKEKKKGNKLKTSSDGTNNFKWSNVPSFRKKIRITNLCVNRVSFSRLLPLFQNKCPFRIYVGQLSLCWPSITIELSRLTTSN